MVSFGYVQHTQHLRFEQSEQQQMIFNTNQHLSKLQVSDSTFLGFVTLLHDSKDVPKLQTLLKERYTNAAHVPYAWSSKDNKDKGWEEDDEPNQSVGPILLHELK